MLFLRAAFLEFLLCFHVVGAAVLFRRIFPRESPWICYLVPILAVLSILNFVEHFIALPSLGWLLPFTLAGLAWAMFRPGYRWSGLVFPTILFLVTFTFIFGIKCSWPEIFNGNEGIFNMTRVLGYSLGGTLPPKDPFLPPYDYGGYYSFQHYGAAILKRLFSTDLGTAYNVSFAFLLTWLCLMAAGVAHSISGKRWIAIVTMLVVMAASNGSYPFILLWGHGIDGYALSTNININWDRPDLNPLAWLCAHDKFHPDLTLEPPLINLYWSEFHSTLGGNFVTIAAMLACSEVFKLERQDWPWVCLVALPVIVIITSAWFFFIVFFLCAGSFALAWLAGRRPQNFRFVCTASAVALVALWPFAYAITGLSSPEQFRWTLPEERTVPWIFLLQWWPVFFPWLLLCLVWRRLDLRSRWIHFAMPLLFIGVELVTFGDRKLMTEKMWAGIYGVGQVAFLPMLLMQNKTSLRFVGACLLLSGFFCLGANLSEFYPHPFSGGDSFTLAGDQWVKNEPQKGRILQALQRFHGAVILPGKSYWNYSQAAAVVSFSENECYVAYTFNEFHYGRGGDADYRSKLNNAFYDGKIDAPLSFLRGNQIDAVLIWPEDAVSGPLLQQFKDQLGSEFFYIDCKMDGADNAGVFVRQSPLISTPVMGHAQPRVGGWLTLALALISLTVFLNRVRWFPPEWSRHLRFLHN